MAKVQNDKSNPDKSGNKSSQKSSEDGKRRETDPNNPTAGKDKQESSKQSTQQQSGSTSQKGK